LGIRSEANINICLYIEIPMSSLSFDVLLQGLKAVGEPTRLRLLALLADGELTVSEVCELVGQSQPRVSRHLRVLCDAGLLDRFREEHWVYYRLPVQGPGADLARQLIELMPPEDETLVLDRERRDRVVAARAAGVGPAGSGARRESAEAVRELGPLLLAELGADGAGDLLDIGTGEGHLLRALAPAARRAVGIDVATSALRVARSQLYVAGLGRCEIKRGDMYHVDAPDGSFDTVTMDRILAEATDPLAALHEAGRVLRAGGRLIVVEEFDALAPRAGTNPLAVVRDWLATAGLACERLHPVDTAAGHLLIAVGRPSQAAVAA